MAQLDLEHALDSLAARMTTAGRVPVGHRRDGRPIWPIFGAEDAPPTPAPADPPAPTPPAPPADPGFPAGTAVADMTSEQQAAYWKHQSRKHEDRVKSFGDLTTDQLKDLRDKASRADKLDYDLSSATDKAVADARRETEREVGDRLRSQLVDTAFRIAVGDRKTADEVADFISDLNLSRFLNADGSVDTAKVLARVDQFAPATGNQQQRPAGPSASGQGNRSGGNGSRPGTGSVGSGADLYREMHPAKK